ncbi:hypothetical protein Cni_G11845 [Canna indica]|uniref:Uncharacterized protein n=1 Tax=Canna indica TaxID=4628 RepID=A0AAQ3K8Q2_9LILI|nr:hypothetical protein Cni_G11845 [Canna indica]
METLVAVPHHRNQYCSRSKSRIRNHFDSSPPRGFKGTNCRTFHSGAAFLPFPPHNDFPFNSHSEHKSPGYCSEPTKRGGKSKPIAINPPPAPKGATFTTDLSRSELWAGPAFSNSPPPSSLPVPKFSLKVRRTVSLELQLPKSELQPMSKSAPSSPTRESTSSLGLFLHNNAAATENLRRILNLDITDD